MLSEELSRDELDTLSGALDSVGWTADPTLRITFVSPGATAVFGDPRGAWSDAPDFLASRLHPDEHRLMGAASDEVPARPGSRMSDVDERAALAPGYVLVVDDDDDILFMMEIVLEQEGFVVRTAHNGQEALETIREHMPRVVLLDLMMPVMNGWEFIRRFRDLYQHTTPIVVVSAIDAPRRRAAEIGAEDWLAKPFEVAALREMVRRHTP